MKHSTAQLGFTLIEIIVTLAIAAILLTIAVPSFHGFIKNSRLTTTADDLVHSLAFAKSEAVKRSTAVSICASDTGTSCTDTPWHEGWIVFTDSSAGVLIAGVVDGTDTVLSVHDVAPNGLMMNLDAGTGKYIRFLPDGGLVQQ